MRWTRRRARPTPAAPVAAAPAAGDDRGEPWAEVARLERRVQELEQRVEDAEDLATAALAPDRLDELAARLDHAVVDLVHRDELLDVRFHSARLAGDVARLSTELRAEIERAVAERLAVAVDHPTVHADPRSTGDPGRRGPRVARA